MTEKIYHITAQASWSAAQEQGVYTAPSLETEGFIHCSKAEQVLRVANAFYRARPDLVLLEIDPAALRSEIRWEAGTDKPDELFPHLYGPLNLEAVVRVLDFPPAPDGLFYRFPS